jgi:hypothetical protein
MSQKCQKEKNGIAAKNDVHGLVHSITSLAETSKVGGDVSHSGLGGLRVDGQLELGRLLDWQSVHRRQSVLAPRKATRGRV